MSPGRKAPPRLDPEEKRHGEEHQYGRECDSEVRPKRGQTDADQCREIRGPNGIQREEVLVSDQQDASREGDRRGTGERETAREPGQTDDHGDRASRKTGRARRAAQRKDEKSDAEQGTLGPCEEQKSDERTADRAGTDVAGGRTRERDKKQRAYKRGDRERVERDVCRSERGASEARERRSDIATEHWSVARRAVVGVHRLSPFGLRVPVQATAATCCRDGRCRAGRISTHRRQRIGRRQ